MKKLVVANWKANAPIISNFKFLISNDLEIGIAASFPFIDKLPPEVTRVAQDVSQFPNGAYTGEVTAQMLKKLNVKYCLVGHAERRKYFRETSEIIQQKISQLKNNNIIPIVCVQTAGEIPPNAEFVMYEPLSAISTPGDFHPETVENVLEFKKNVKGKFLYGGSISPKNVENYAQFDGLVVGQASLDPKTFYELLCQIKT